MISVKMLDDFALMVKAIESEGQFKAYQDYCQKYPQLFKSVVEGLFVTLIDALRHMIEPVDFNALLAIGMKNRAIAEGLGACSA